MSDGDRRTIEEEVLDLAEERGGQFHRDDLTVRLLERSDISEGTAREFVSEFPFDDRGFAYGKPDAFDIESFGGDVGSLEMTPGMPMDEWFHSLRKLEPTSHPLVPSVETYYERSMELADVDDVQVLCRTLADPDFSPLLQGEAGTGKDTLVLHVCSQTNRPVVRVNFGSDVRYEDLVGMHVLTDDGEMRWRDGQLTKAVRYGWVFIADEINAAPPEATMPLHQVTEERDKAGLVIRETNEIVDPHPQFRFVATMNPPRGGYGGTKQLNDAFRSRFYTIELDYLDAEHEADLLEDVVEADVSRESLEQLTELASRLRSQYKRSGIETPITTRELLKVCKLTGMMSLEEATQTVLVGHAKENDQELIEEIVRDFRL